MSENQKPQLGENIKAGAILGIDTDGKVIAEIKEEVQLTSYFAGRAHEKVSFSEVEQCIKGVQGLIKAIHPEKSRGAEGEKSDPIPPSTEKTAIYLRPIGYQRFRIERKKSDPIPPSTEKTSTGEEGAKS